MLCGERGVGMGRLIRVRVGGEEGTLMCLYWIDLGDS